MSALKKTLYVAGESKLEEETKRFNKRALIGSIIIHLFFFLIKLPHLVLEHKMHDDPKLEPIKMLLITTAEKSLLVKHKLIAEESEKIAKIAEDQKLKNGTDKVVKNSDRLGDITKNKNQKVQKGDPASKLKTAYKPDTELRKVPKTNIGSGAAPSKVPSKNSNTGGSGDTYKGIDMKNITDSIKKSGTAISRIKTNPNAKDDGGAGGGQGGGIGDGIGGGSGSGSFTGTTKGTTNIKKVATNQGSLTGSAVGKIDTTKGFEGLATKGTVMIAGIPVEKITVSTIDPDVIRRLLRENIPQFRHCYQKELEITKNPEGFSGVMSFRFFIAESGSVSRSEIKSDEITSDIIRDCMKNVLQGIRFPSHHSGKGVEVNQPMNLYPKRI